MIERFISALIELSRGSRVRSVCLSHFIALSRYWTHRATSYRLALVSHVRTLIAREKDVSNGWDPQFFLASETYAHKHVGTHFSSLRFVVVIS